MITVYQRGELHFQNKIYRCALGRNGVKKKNKKEMAVHQRARIHLVIYTIVLIELRS